MGKGGDKSSKVTDSGVSKGFKLAHMADAELRKWAKAYGEKAEGRDEILAALNPMADGILKEGRIDNLPLERPPFTLVDIQKAIPAHCFQRSLTNSVFYLLIDLLKIAIMAYGATFIGDHTILPEWSDYVLWPVYWFCQGAVMTGVWVLAHECGHQSFSESEFWNNTFGTVLHSLLLVPYHSWRLTHKKHHENTGSCENDEVFAPSTIDDFKDELLRETPIAQCIGILLMLTVGWMPGYLIFGITGPAKYKGKNVNHFSPTATFFKPEEKWLIIQTDIAFFSVLASVIYACVTYGTGLVAFYYFLPLTVTNAYLVLITYLQHTAPYVPHFRGKEWSFLRGALCTIDRSFGAVLNHTFHHITDTHVCHHLFSKMPFYHAQEATEAIKSVIGKYYLKDDTPIAEAVYHSFSTCQYVEPEGTTVFFKNIK